MIENRAQARDLIRSALHFTTVALDDRVETVLAELLLEHNQAGRREGEHAVSETLMGPVFDLIGSALIRLRCLEAAAYLKRHAHGMLISASLEQADDLLREAIKDLSKAADKDDRIPF